MKNKLLLFLLPLSIFASAAHAQKSLLDELGADEKTIDYAKYSFKTNRIINMHSLENTAEGVLDMKISHRFGVVDQGIYDLFGLDYATQRIGFDYGVTDDLCVGVNRNSVKKALDGFVKYRILRQSTGKVNMPVTLSVLSSLACETQKWANPARDNKFSSRLFYTNQILVGRKFNDVFTLELAPTMVHRNLVATKSEKNTVFAMGVGGRVRLNRRTTFNAEYIYVLPNQLGDGYKNSLSIGFDIETGGHVFQLHFTNSISMSEYSFITQNTESWGKNAVRFGFNVSRVFTMYETANNKKKKD
jgi:Membrane bound beta barrel domain (DUF5777)